MHKTLARRASRDARQSETPTKLARPTPLGPALTVRCCVRARRASTWRTRRPASAARARDWASAMRQKQYWKKAQRSTSARQRTESDPSDTNRAQPAAAAKRRNNKRSDGLRSTTRAGDEHL